MSEVKPEAIIHLAAMPQAQCQLDPQSALAVNTEGTRRLLNVADQLGVKRFIYFSTFQVYGKLIGKVSEENRPYPENPYAQSKLKAEEVIDQFQSQQAMRTLIVRLSNGFGYPAGENVGEHIWGLVFNAFCQQCFAARVITIRSNQYRDFITLEDVARAVDHFLFMPSTAGLEGVFNLGGDCCLSVFEVAQQVKQVYEKHYRRSVEIKAPVAEDQNLFKRFHYCIDKLRATGFVRQDRREEEILKTLQLCEKKYV